MSDATPWIVAEDRGDVRKHAPATLRNREAIATELAELLPDAGSVLEVASGSGEHAAFFAGRFPTLSFVPSDPDPDGRASIASWCAGLANVASPLAIDAAAPEWPIGAADAILCINMVHISPWAATLGLLDGAARLLPVGGPLILYGPYRRADVPTAPSNEAFDASLRARDPCWGLRDVADVTGAAAARGLRFDRLVEMPANNILLVYRR
ncbi:MULTISPECIES: class I SAM-dependent methyltransferase [unclassified Sphingomonas]|uniref:class I SAM-dependent methyltransferase n=1 Tax=unclassified Sphingomonas TaxID=196159 RepID=UPI002151B166|nr:MULTISPECIES: class I SAM-dependent methyltransferase [unclassified Sphingomonas]MCR5871587.1 class I SAM-dependent methyltransferase [Sphingomonas sp. J344]UUY00117.1 class I SAM-dependent methyltransferase [Sphingomonas sp. J315]